MNALLVYYDNGQLQAADDASDSLKDLCFLHNAFLTAGEFRAAKHIRDGILEFDKSSLPLINDLYSFYADSKITNDQKYHLDNTRTANIDDQTITISSKGKKLITFDTPRGGTNQ